MALNYIWVGFFLIAFITGLVKLLFWGDMTVFPAMVDSLFSMAETGATISLGYIGLMTLWLGIMKIGEAGGVVNFMARLVAPFFTRIFPEVPKGHPAYGSMMMNFAANMLGLDNAATPLGLKAMNHLQELNPNKETASNAQIMFLVLNTSGLTIIPISVITLRAANGAVNPTDIFVPILIATYVASLAGLLAVAIVQKLNLFAPVVFAYLGGASALIGGMTYYFGTLSPEAIQQQSTLIAAIVIFLLIVVFVLSAVIANINVYETFIEGAKDGFGVTIKIIPFLVGMLVAIGVFRASGAMREIVNGVAWIVGMLGFNTDFVDALPTAIMKPLSGSGARGMAVEAMQSYGVDSFVGRLACVFQGSTETTFYTLAVYFGAVGVRRTRYTVTCGLIADAAGIIAAIFVAYLFFH
jgi:spore maturation protein SpmA